MTIAWCTLPGDNGPEKKRRSGWLRELPVRGQNPARGRLPSNEVILLLP